jgi:uncharacterized membrane protein
LWIALAPPPYHALLVEFARLLLAALAWFLLHAAVAGSAAREQLVARFGPKRFRSGFSLASLVSLWWLVSEYRGAPFRSLWSTPSALGWVPLAVMPLASVLLVGAFLTPNPTAIDGERHLRPGEPARGVLAITRHPFLWGVALWAAAHLLVNGDVGSQLFFASMGLTALWGTADIDRKRLRATPREYADFMGRTSNVPLAAVLGGRARLVVRECWLPLALGLALALGAAALHPHVLGTPAVPGLYG